MTTEATTEGAATSEATGAQDAAAATTTATTDQSTAKPADATTPPKDDGAKAESKTEEPVAYEFKTPEGVELDSGLADKFKAIASELKLPADGAQKVVDLYASVRQAEAEAFAKQVSDWGEAVKADKEIGGDKLPENLAAARKVIDTFGSEDIKSLLDSTGMGNHPEVVRLLVKVGKALSEDTFVRGKPAPAVPKDAASVLYGN